MNGLLLHPKGKGATGYSVSEERVKSVLAAIEAGADCVNTIVRSTRFSRSCVHYSVKKLLARKLVVLAGTRPSHGGAHTQLLSLPGCAKPVEVIRAFSCGHLKSKENSYAYFFNGELQHKCLTCKRDAAAYYAMLGPKKIPQQRTEKYHGKPAGKIVIGRGAKWGAGLV